MLTEAERIIRLEPPAVDGPPLEIVLDTDTYNEIDDQFALAYALLSPERLDVQAIYAAPFSNERTGPGEGMRLSFEEIRRVLDRLDRNADDLAYRGSDGWLDGRTAVSSPATDDLIARARSMSGDRPLYVVAIGAPTNVSSALLAAPDIADRIVVVWLGGNPTSWHDAAEYNLQQDPAASRVLFDSGVPLVHVPCVNVTEHLRTTLAEVDRYIRPSGAIGQYLADIYAEHCGDEPGRSKVLWDIGAVACLVNPAWTPSALTYSPILTSELTWSYDPRRHLVRELLGVRRDPIFADLFLKLPGGLPAPTH